MNLGWNQITDKGARILAHSPTLSRLEILALDSNHIGDPGALDSVEDAIRDFRNDPVHCRAELAQR